PQASYVHSGWWSEDKMAMLVHDERDERDERDEHNHGLNSTVRLFDISNLTNPQLLSVWTGPTQAIDHNGFVRGSRITCPITSVGKPFWISLTRHNRSMWDFLTPTGSCILKSLGYSDTL
ncbi:MAG: hypothetical protein ACI9FJ_002651, partial [Alteromonadaceae bacterium]